MIAWILLFFYISSVCSVGNIEILMKEYRDKVESMFYHAYDGYLNHAYPLDELRPLTCDGQDTWGGYSLTLVDSLDTLAILGNYTEFKRVHDLLVKTLDFDRDINVSVFETNIRVVGGLLSGHLLSHRAGLTLDPGWPCSGQLLTLAENLARRLLPAFQTPTGMPYGTVNLRHGVPRNETPITCTAGVGTFIVEWGALSRLTGDPVFERTARKAMTALWDRRSDIGLVGNHIDVLTGKWTAVDAGIGAGIDSYFEYLVKGASLFAYTEYMHMFKEYSSAFERHIKKEDWYLWAHMKKGSITLPVFQSLEAFWPGVQSMVGEVEKGLKSLHNYHQVWQQFGFTPEFYNIPKMEVHSSREGYPLRPELVESTMYLYQATKDPFLLSVGIDIYESIETRTKTSCGYATVQSVVDHKLTNRMESFFLAETTKYLYLLFSNESHFIHNTGSHGTVINTSSGECVIDAGGYIFNTEAHPVDGAALYCCSADKEHDDLTLLDFHDNLDLLDLFDLVPRHQREYVTDNKLVSPPGMDDVSVDDLKLLLHEHRKSDLDAEKKQTNEDLGVVVPEGEANTAEKQQQGQQTDLTPPGQGDNKNTIDSILEALSNTLQMFIMDMKDIKIAGKDVKIAGGKTSEKGEKENADESMPETESVKKTSHLGKDSYEVNVKKKTLPAKSASDDTSIDTKEQVHAKTSHTQTPGNLKPHTRAHMHHKPQLRAHRGNTLHMQHTHSNEPVCDLPGRTHQYVDEPVCSLHEERTHTNKLISDLTHKYTTLMSCPAQPFYMRFTMMGEFFDL